MLETVLEKIEFVDTCTVNDAARAVTLQLKVGAMVVFCMPLDGELRITAPGTFGIVVKFQIDDHTPVPAAFVAATRQ